MIGEILVLTSCKARRAGDGPMLQLSFPEEVMSFSNYRAESIVNLSIPVCSIDSCISTFSIWIRG